MEEQIKKTIFVNRRRGNLSFFDYIKSEYSDLLKFSLLLSLGGYLFAITIIILRIIHSWIGRFDIVFNHISSFGIKGLLIEYSSNPLWGPYLIHFSKLLFSILLLKLSVSVLFYITNAELLYEFYEDRVRYIVITKEDREEKEFMKTDIFKIKISRKGFFAKVKNSKDRISFKKISNEELSFLKEYFRGTLKS